MSLRWGRLTREGCDGYDPRCPDLEDVAWGFPIGTLVGADGFTFSGALLPTGVPLGLAEKSGMSLRLFFIAVAVSDGGAPPRQAVRAAAKVRVFCDTATPDFKIRS